MVGWGLLGVFTSPLLHYLHICKYICLSRKSSDQVFVDWRSAVIEKGFLVLFFFSLWKVAGSQMFCGVYAATKIISEHSSMATVFQNLVEAKMGFSSSVTKLISTDSSQVKGKYIAQANIH